MRNDLSLQWGCPAFRLCSVGMLILSLSLISGCGLQEVQQQSKELEKQSHRLQTDGQYAQALLLQQELLALEEKTWGPDHPKVATGLIRLATLYRQMGDYEKPEPLYQRVLKIREKQGGSHSVGVAIALTALGRLYFDKGDYAKAEPLLQQALSVREQDFNDLRVVEFLPGQNIPVSEAASRTVANALSTLGALYMVAGPLEKAEPLFQEALARREQALGPDDPEVATAVNDKALLYHAKEDYAKAKPLYLRAVSIMEKSFGPSHPNVASSLQLLAWLTAAQQQYQSAFGYCQKALTLQGRQIQNVFAHTTEEQKLAFIQTVSGGYTTCLSLLHQYLKEERGFVRDGLELVLHRKGTVFDAQSRLSDVLRGRLSEEDRKEWDHLSALRSELAHLLLYKTSEMSVDQGRERIIILQQQIEAVEKGLAKKSALVGKELRQRTITVEAVAQQLPRNAALVEFVKIRDFDFAKGKAGSSWRYLAFVLASTNDVTLVDLGEASALENQARQALKDIRVLMGARAIEIVKKPQGRDPVRRSLQSLQGLSAKLWAPLEKALGPADKVVISPDGLLNLVPFTALIDREGRPLIERYRLAYVSSGRELLASAGEASKPGSDLLLVANPTYDQKVKGTGGQGPSVRSRDFQGNFSPLPGTEREAKDIPPLVPSRERKQSVFVEENATESVVKTARSPRIMHLATHGFFLQDEEVAVEDDTRGVTVARKELTSMSAKQAASKRYENPLVRSGLAFAGANYAAQTSQGDDGILTALEITGMDLYGTELVVLSACDTGVGEVMAGEGVFGLRRAFALAGAQNLMMSLWPVSDEITANQMKAFYRNLQKLPPAEALRQAQLETIKELKDAYGVAAPSLWAPFILQGAQALGQ